VFRCDPFHPAVGTHADGEAVFGDQWVVKRADQAHRLDVGQSAVLVLIQMMHLSPLWRHVATGPVAPTVSGVQGQALDGGGEAGTATIGIWP